MRFLSLSEWRNWNLWEDWEFVWLWTQLNFGLEIQCFWYLSVLICVFVWFVLMCWTEDSLCFWQCHEFAQTKWLALWRNQVIWGQPEKGFRPFGPRKRMKTIMYPNSSPMCFGGKQLWYFEAWPWTCQTSITRRRDKIFRFFKSESAPYVFLMVSPTCPPALMPFGFFNDHDDGSLANWRILVLHGPLATKPCNVALVYNDHRKPLPSCFGLEKTAGWSHHCRLGELGRLQWDQDIGRSPKRCECGLLVQLQSGERRRQAEDHGASTWFGLCCTCSQSHHRENSSYGSFGDDWWLECTASRHFLYGERMVSCVAWMESTVADAFWWFWLGFGGQRLLEVSLQCLYPRVLAIGCWHVCRSKGRRVSGDYGSSTNLLRFHDALLQPLSQQLKSSGHRAQSRIRFNLS